MGDIYYEFKMYFCTSIDRTEDYGMAESKSPTTRDNIPVPQQDNARCLDGKKPCAGNPGLYTDRFESLTA